MYPSKESLLLQLAQISSNSLRRDLKARGELGDFDPPVLQSEGDDPAMALGLEERSRSGSRRHLVGRIE